MSTAPPRWPKQECLHEQVAFGFRLTLAGRVVFTVADRCVDCRAELLCPAVSAEGDRCAHLSNHAGAHGATNAAGVVCVEWA